MISCSSNEGRWGWVQEGAGTYSKISWLVMDTTRRLSLISRWFFTTRCSAIYVLYYLLYVCELQNNSLCTLFSLKNLSYLCIRTSGQWSLYKRINYRKKTMFWIFLIHPHRNSAYELIMHLIKSTIKKHSETLLFKSSANSFSSLKSCEEFLRFQLTRTILIFSNSG
jgi:hypothetical protein